MKRILMLAAVLLLIFAVNIETAEAAPGPGILRSLDKYNMGTVGFLKGGAPNDGNDSTFSTLTPGQTYKATLSKNIDLVGYYFNGESGLEMRLYYGGSTLVSTIYPHSSKSAYTPISVKINYLEIENKSTSNKKLYDFDIYRNTTAPQDVSQIVTQPLSSSEIKISWQIPSDPLLQRIVIYKDDKQLVILNKNTNTYTAKSLEQFVDHKFTIKTENEHGDQSDGVTFFARTLEPNMTPPSEISDLQSFVYADRIKFTWTNPPEVDYHEVRIYRGGVMIATAVTPANQFTDYDLSEHTTYTFMFRSVNKDGAVSEGVSVTETTKGKPRGTIMLEGSADEGTAYLSWTQNNEAEKYYVFQDGLMIADVAETSYTVEGLENGQAYEFKVQPYNEWGLGTISNAITLQPIEIPIPEAPTNVRYTATNTTITLTWQPSEYATEYRIYQIKQSETSFFEKILFDRAYAAEEEYIGSTSGTTYTITNLEAGEERTFLVSAANQKGESAKTTVAAKTSAEITWGLTVLELLQAVFQFIMVFANFIILGAIIIFAPRVVRFFKQIAAKNGVKF